MQVLVFKKKARKRYTKLKGHRSHITALRILEVRQPAAEAAVSNIQAISPGQEAAPRAALGITGRQLTPQQLKQMRKKLVAGAVRPQQQQQAGTADGQEAGAGQQQQQQQTVDRHGKRQHGPPAVMDAFPRPLRGNSTRQESP